MDAEGARELTRRIGSKAPLAPRPVPAGMSAGALSLYRSFGGVDDAMVPATEPTPPVRRTTARRVRFSAR
jgi:hypothetical protein